MDPSTSQPKEIPHIDILFLGSPGVGKATFLSRLPSVQHPSVTRRAAAQNTNPSTTTPPSTASQSSIPPANPPPPYTSTTSLPLPSYTTPTPPIAPLTAPLTFNVSLFARPYSITIHPSTSPLFTDTFPATPHFIIICFSTASRSSLHNAQHYWLPQFHLHYPNSSAALMLLGLQRDLRNLDVEDVDGEDGEGKRYVCMMPEEGLEAARAMRADRYAECSALTGELMYEVVEDITRTAAKATTDGEYASGMCEVM